MTDHTFKILTVAKVKLLPWQHIADMEEASSEIFASFN